MSISSIFSLTYCSLPYYHGMTQISKDTAITWDRPLNFLRTIRELGGKPPQSLLRDVENWQDEVGTWQQLMHNACSRQPQVSETGVKIAWGLCFSLSSQEDSEPQNYQHSAITSRPQAWDERLRASERTLSLLLTNCNQVSEETPQASPKASSLQH